MKEANGEREREMFSSWKPEYESGLSDGREKVKVNKVRGRGRR